MKSAQTYQQSINCTVTGRGRPLSFSNRRVASASRAGIGRSDGCYRKGVIFRTLFPCFKNPRDNGSPKGATMTLYKDLLRDPRWQKMRLEILSRDKFTCQSCSCTDQTLHVHHRYYDFKLKPWEYPATSLVTLCAVCHDNEGADLPKIRHALSVAMGNCGFDCEDILTLATALNAAAKDGRVIVDAIFWQVANDDRRRSLINQAGLGDES